MAGMQHRRRNFTAVAWRIVLEASSVLPTKQQTTPAVSHALQPAHRTQPANPTNPKPNPTQLNLPHPTQPTPPYLTYPTPPSLTSIPIKSIKRSIAAAADPGSLRQIFPTARMACLASSGSMSPAYSPSSAMTASAELPSASRARQRTLAYFTPVGSLYLQNHSKETNRFGLVLDGFIFVSFCFVSVRFGSVCLGLLWLGWVGLG